MRTTRVLAVVMVFVNWSTLISSVDQMSTFFKVIRKGQIPVAGMKLLRHFSTDSVFECARDCWNDGDNVGCGGFVYEPVSCSDNNVTPSQSGECQTLDLQDADSLTYGPANSSCHEFYVTPSTAGKTSMREQSCVIFEQLNEFLTSSSLSLIKKPNIEVNQTAG